MVDCNKVFLALKIRCEHIAVIPEAIGLGDRTSMADTGHPANSLAAECPDTVLRKTASNTCGGKKKKNTLTYISETLGLKMHTHWLREI